MDLSEHAHKFQVAAAAAAKTFPCKDCGIAFTNEEDIRQHNFFKHSDKKAAAVQQLQQSHPLGVGDMQVGGYGCSPLFFSSLFNSVEKLKN